MKKTLSLLLAVLMVITALPLTAITSFAATSGDFEYSVISEEDKTCEITKYKGSATNLAIPSTLDGYSVTTIGDRAFEDCTSLASITIPDSVTSIGLGAFDNTAYYNDATNWENDVLYIGKYLIKAKDTISGDYVVKYGTKTIADHAFYDCISLASITIPNSVTSIGDGAFYVCTALESITIGNSVSKIGDSAFYDCTALESITIPDSVTSIGKSAFSCCTSLASITIPDSVTSIGSYAFEDCTSLESINVSNDNKAYSSVDGVLFDKDKTELIRYPIGNARTTYTIPNSVTVIGIGAFSGCESLTSITIPDSVTSIGLGAFSHCTGLASVTIPDSVKSIGGYAFYNCTSLTSITIPDSVTSIGDLAFYYCTSLTRITIPNSVTSIGSLAFEFCESLASVTIGNGVTSIGWGTFENCTSLASITIPDSVTSIGDGAFYDCTALEAVYYTGTETQWNAIGIEEGNENLTYAAIHYNYVISNLNGLDNESSKHTGRDDDEKATNKVVEDNQVWLYLGLIVAILIIVAIITWLVLSRRKRKNGNKQVD
ncbi:MAG: leucine-rich repeat domain-containing protein [Candidatus Fimenecus sp.]